MKHITKIIMIVAVIAGGVFVIRFLSGPEDDWICAGGQWVQHGRPYAPKPEGGCGDSASSPSASQILPGSDRDSHGCIGSAGYFWCQSKRHCLRPFEEYCPTGGEETISGTAAKNLPGFDKDRLYVLYEQPGKPALSLQLQFDEKSLCGDAEHKISCVALSVSDYGLYNGRKIAVVGVRNGSMLSVKSLEYAAAASPEPSASISTGGGQGIAPYDSGVRGTVTLNPACPVERIPPDPNCADKPYKTLVTIFRASDATHAFVITESDAQGNFNSALPPGDYTVGAGENNLPRCDHEQFTVSPGKYVSVAVSCDTGIR
jgi:hypothetical protein